MKFSSRKWSCFLFLAGLPAFLVLLFLSVPLVRAQEGPQGPMEAPKDHHVTRIGNEPEPPAPPSLPPQEIIQRFAKKEDEYLKTRPEYSFRKTVHIQEFGPDGSPSGDFLRVTDYTRMADGHVAVKAIEKPQSTLQGIYLVPEDLEALDRIPAFPLTTNQLSKYDLKYIGKEQVDEIDCYIFQVKPKMVERTRAYFDGVVWVDAKYLEVVKTYGTWVTEQGNAHAIEQLPFSLFETYRENVDGKYWFPDYLRSDDVLHSKEGDIPVRLVVKWSNFTAAPANGASAPAPASAPTTPPANSPATSTPPPAPNP